MDDTCFTGARAVASLRSAEIVTKESDPANGAGRVSRGRLARAAAGERVPFPTGHGELKYGAARFVRLRPQPAPMVGDDGPADWQPHAHSAALRGVKSLENALDLVRIDAPSRIAHCYEDAVGSVVRSADR